MPHYSHLLNKWLSFTLVSLEGLGKLFSHILADSKEINSVIPKRNQPWIFIGMTDAEAETPILGPLGVKSQLVWKDPDAEKDWRWEEKGTTEDKMVGWHHRLNGHKFEQAPGDGDGQGSLVCCSAWGCKKLDTAERLKNIGQELPMRRRYWQNDEHLSQVFWWPEWPAFFQKQVSGEAEARVSSCL